MASAESITPICALPNSEPTDRVSRFRSKLQVHNDLCRCLLAEFFSTALLMFGGTSSTAQFVLSKGQLGGPMTSLIGWGISIVLAVYSGFRISGSHMNPAVSFFNAVYGNISMRRAFLYGIAQTSGSLCGSFLTYVMYYDAINNYDGGLRQVTGPQATITIFVPFPQDYLTIWGSVVDQVLGTAFLCVCVAMVSDKRNEIPLALQPLVIGLTVTLLGFCACLNAGYEINPARDVGPKIMALLVGYGWQVVSFRSYTWFAVPIVCPFFGALLGSWTYQIFIGFHIPDEEESKSTALGKHFGKNIDRLRI